MQKEKMPKRPTNGKKLRCQQMAKTQVPNGKKLRDQKVKQEKKQV